MTVLDEIVSAQNQGEPKGIPSVCSAHPTVMEAALRHALETNTPVLVEATCNQVNQYGGYTEMTPADFMAYVSEMAARLGFPEERLILGGDHLGPNVWQGEPARVAMEKAAMLVRDYIRAGFCKIHLDASMRLGGDPAGIPMPVEVAARRAAELAQVAEAAFQRRGTGPAPRYVIGTEVPIPGGAQEKEDQLQVTAVSDVAETLEITRLAFHRRGLEAAWRRVIAVVVQPGVEFGDATIHEYDRAQAAPLARFIEADPQLVFEVHSTDYQTRQALRQMVEDHFAILKVGPALTFAFREAVFALAMIEDELFTGPRVAERSHLREVLETAMLRNPAAWTKYYVGDVQAQQFARKYSFSDRSRYYWPIPEVQAALVSMIRNLGKQPLPLSLLSQFLPTQYERIRSRTLANSPRAIIGDKIAAVFADYAYACGYEIYL